MAGRAYAWPLGAQAVAPPGQVLEALEAATAYRPLALDAPLVHGDGVCETLGETLGRDDPRYEIAELWTTAASGFDTLSQRERTVLRLRFFEDMTQSEIAQHVGVSQMHVSRILRTALGKLTDATTDVEMSGFGAGARFHAAAR